MCYSAQVIQVVRKLHREFGIRLDYEEALKLFTRRLDDASVVISRGFEANFDDPTNDQELRIKAAIETHRSRSITKLETDLFLQKTRLVGAERALKVKETRRAKEDLRIASTKIETLTSKLGALRNKQQISEDDRIFPMVYAGIIVQQEGQKLLTPMRYFCRPAGKPASLDKQFPGLYNARRNNLEKFWSEQFGSHHAIMVVESFYENVKRHILERGERETGGKEQNVVLRFTPDPPQTMYIACLWSHWTHARDPDIRGFAAITDEPPAAIAAAGHDRCIINLKPEHIETWLTPRGRSAEELQAVLSDREIPVIQHAMAA